MALGEEIGCPGREARVAPVARPVHVLVVDDHVPLARTIARWLDRDGMACDVAHSAANAMTRLELHDIGKIGISGGILRKTGPLTADEMAEIRRHPEIGIGILSPLLDDRTALDVVLYHHEAWDGSGYPAGLAGEDTPVAARVAAVADAFDAMTNARPYRGARTPREAVAELESEAGRQFDPEITRHVAAAFLGEVATATIQS